MGLAVLSTLVFSGCGFNNDSSSIVSKLFSSSSNAESSSKEDKIGDYVLNNSSRELLSEEDIINLTYDELVHARDEIYARHGKIFEDLETREYFNGKGWYSPSTGYSDDELTLLEKQNIDLIDEGIQKMKPTKAIANLKRTNRGLIDEGMQKMKPTTTTQTTTEATTAKADPVQQPVNPPAPIVIEPNRHDDSYVNDEITYLIEGYCTSFVNAVNTGSYSLVSGYIYPGSALDTTQRNFIRKSYNNGTKESFEGCTINSITYVNNNMYYVNVTETETISTKTKTETKTYHWIYTAERYNGSFMLSNIEKA